MQVDSPWRWLEPVVLLAKKSGEAILSYQTGSSTALDINTKKDNTVVTKADVKSHEIIHATLKKLTPDLPVLSEEGLIPDYAERSQWKRYWLVDPLDGTRGFIEHRSEFTVNIALIEQHRPVLGVVYVPATKECYFAVKDRGAFKQCDNQNPEPIQTSPINPNFIRVLLGHYLSSTRLPDLFKDLPQYHVDRINSSLKFCLISEGKADIYPRLGKTSEWDTAAAQSVLEEAGGMIVDLEGNALQYNAKVSLENPAFLALGDPAQQAKVLALIQAVRKIE